jgi:hypothetical protein
MTSGHSLCQIKERRPAVQGSHLLVNDAICWGRGTSSLKGGDAGKQGLFKDGLTGRAAPCNQLLTQITIQYFARSIKEVLLWTSDISAACQ